MPAPIASLSAPARPLRVALCIASALLGACLDETSRLPASDCDAELRCRASDSSVPDGGGSEPPLDSAAPRVEAVSEDDAGAPAACTRDEACDDRRFCNGQERCQPSAAGADERGCVAAPRGPCAARACDEASRSCDCSEPDMDGDGYNASGCENAQNEPDCDDQNAAIHPGATEVCDAEGVDEDCRPETVGERDEDGDGYTSAECRNTDPATGVVHRSAKPDCDDANSDVHPDQSDNPCNGLDDNCDGEREEARWTYYADADGDRFGDQAAPIGTACETPPPGFVLGDAFDCDDSTPDRAPDRAERCDGMDNDCDGQVDESIRFDPLPRIRLACVAGRAQVTCDPGFLECDQDMDELCEVPSGTLSDCRACGQACSFSCGADGCDEVRAVAVGGEHACAVTEAGAVACWGHAAYGQLGIDSRNNSHAPAKTIGLPAAQKLALGGTHSCAIAGAERTLYCWGDNSQQQLGVSGVQAALIPSPVGGVLTSELSAVSDVALGAAHGCAVFDAGRVACWGAGESGRLGDADTTAHFGWPQLVIRAPGASFVDDAAAVAAGYAHSCLVTTQGVVECWGDNSAGQLGLGRERDLERSAVAVRADAPLSSVVALAAGAFHTCALRDSQVYCWGSNFYGQLGRVIESQAGAPANFDPEPRPVLGLGDVEQIALGHYFTCARERAGKVHCWGHNGDGQRGDATFTPSEARSVVQLADVSQLAAGGASACAVTGRGSKVWCWGANATGQLGSGAASSQPEPVPQPLHWLLGSTP